MLFDTTITQKKKKIYTQIPMKSCESSKNKKKKKNKDPKSSKIVGGWVFCIAHKSHTPSFFLLLLMRNGNLIITITTSLDQTKRLVHFFVVFLSIRQKLGLCHLGIYFRSSVPILILVAFIQYRYIHRHTHTDDEITSGA